MTRRSFGWTGPLALALVATFSGALSAHASESETRKYSNEEPLGTVLNKIAHELEEHPGDYLERSERAFLMLEAGMTGAPLNEDIDTLLSKPAWRTNALRQLAWRLYLLGRYDEAEAQLRKNLDSGVVWPEQYRLLAAIYLMRHDTAAARAAYREGWNHLKMDEDFISLIPLSKQVGIVPDSLLRAGLRVHPKSSGAHAAVYQAYLDNAQQVRAKAGTVQKRRDAGSVWLAKAIEVSEHAETREWPSSVDWKLRHARALIAAKRLQRAETVLLNAMELLESDARRLADSGTASQTRKEIFALLDSTRVRK
jgi:tetratricopeptide (TPR) repeat protein